MVNFNQLHTPRAHIAIKKDWADHAMAWPFATVIGLALIGLFFSKIITTDSGQWFFSIIAIFTGSYLFVASQIRIYKGKVNWPDKYPFRSKFLMVIMFLFIMYGSSYIAAVHGLTLVIGIFITEPQQKIIQVHDKSRTAGGRGSTVGSIHFDKFVFPSKALHMDRKYLNDILPGDRILLSGRGAWYGLYVDKRSILPRHDTPSTEQAF